MFIYKILNLFVPSTVFFEDRSSVEYLSRNDTLRYISPGRFVVQVPLLYDKKTDTLRAQVFLAKKWEKPAGQDLTGEESSDLKIKITTFIQKKGKPFAESY